MKINFNQYVIKIGSKKIRGVYYNWYKFRIFVNEPNNILQNIDFVEYQLHPTFSNPNRRVSGERRLSKFYLEFEGFAGFDMNIIVRLKDGHDEEYSYTISLDKQWPKEELEGVYLWGADLEGVNLERANLKGANLKHSKLNRAILKNADLSESFLNNAKLEYSNLENAKLIGAHLEDAYLFRAELKNAKFDKAILDRTDFTNAIFDEKTDFQGADVKSTTIDNLDGSNWWDAKWNSWDLEKIKKKYGKK